MIPPREGQRTFPPAGLSRTELLSPRTLEEACVLLAQTRMAGRSVVVLAGGTDWIVDRHLAPIERATPLDVTIDVTRIDELGAIELRELREPAGERRLVLGGGVTYWALRCDPRVVEAVPMLGVMARDVGAVQIQTRGTLAGNIATASPAADGVPALMALEGVVVLRSMAGERRVPLESFFTGYRKTALRPDELIAAIDVRVPRKGAHVTWRKVGTRLAQAISKVALAAVIEDDPSTGAIARARFGMASVAATTVPLAAVRALVEGKRRDAIDREALAAAVAREATPIDDVRSTGAYRAHVARALVERVVFEG
jgi:CO/xanthine dehydrogenase FAD-binding subunit